MTEAHSKKRVTTFISDEDLANLPSVRTPSFGPIRVDPNGLMVYATAANRHLLESNVEQLTAELRDLGAVLPSLTRVGICPLPRSDDLL